MDHEREEQRCGVCLENKVPGLPLFEQVIIYNQLYSWMHICGDCGKICTERATYYYLEQIREQLVIIENWTDCGDDDIECLIYHYLEQLREWLEIVSSWQPSYENALEREP